jgi:hypothetical protein
MYSVQDFQIRLFQFYKIGMGDLRMPIAQGR